MTVGQRVALKRKEQGLSQEALGEALGVSRQSVYKWESDSALPEIDKLIALSRLFHVTVGWLLGVEESAPEGSASPSDAGGPTGELTESQLKMVEEIVDRYLTVRQPVKKKRRWLWIAGIAAGLILCLALHGEVKDVRWDMTLQYTDLKNRLESVTLQMNSQIEGITGRVEEALKSQTDLTVSSSTEIAASDLAANTVTFLVRAVPKTYIEGMTAVFTADSGEDVTEVPAQLGAGQEFSARLTCALTDEITISATFITGETRETQVLDVRYSLYMSSMPEELEVPDTSVALWGKGLDRDGKLSWPGPGEEGYAWIPSSSSVNAIDAQFSPAKARSVRVGLFRNQKLLGWLEPCEKPDSFGSGFQDDGIYRFPEVSVEPEVGDRFQLCVVVEDEYGREFVCAGVTYQWNAETLRLHTEGGEAGLGSPENWEY